MSGWPSCPWPKEHHELMLGLLRDHCAGELPEWALSVDLVFLADRANHPSRRFGFPGRRELERRWGLGERQVRKALRHRDWQDVCERFRIPLPDRRLRGGTGGGAGETEQGVPVGVPRPPPSASPSSSPLRTSERQDSSDSAPVGVPVPVPVGVPVGVHTRASVAPSLRRSRLGQEQHPAAAPPEALGERLVENPNREPDTDSDTDRGTDDPVPSAVLERSAAIVDRDATGTRGTDPREPVAGPPRFPTSAGPGRSSATTPGSGSSTEAPGDSSRTHRGDARPTGGSTPPGELFPDAVARGLGDAGSATASPSPAPSTSSPVARSPNPSSPASPDPSTRTSSAAAPSPIPEWARKAKAGPPIEVRDHVVRVLTAIRVEPPNPMRCASEADVVLKLWKALERPPLGELCDELATVARWARESSDALAANDIRGIRPDGSAWGVDRSRDVETLCVRRRWGVRLDAARRWAAEPERPATPMPARAPPGFVSQATQAASVRQDAKAYAERLREKNRRTHPENPHVLDAHALDATPEPPRLPLRP